MQVILILICIILYAFNANVCDRFYPNNTIDDYNAWHNLKYIFDYAIFCLLTQCICLLESKVIRLFGSVFIGCCVSDIFTIWIPHTVEQMETTTGSDHLAIFSTIIFSIINYITITKLAQLFKRKI